ncbi:MAG: nickel-dependent lactate racemase, partial [Nitrosopumilaceae archaeon]
MYSVPYGKGEIHFEIPEDFKVTVAEPNARSSVKNVNAATREALLHPINSRKLSETAKGKDTACIVVTDITRSCPDKELLPPILEQIEKEVNRKDITILIAAGMHRDMTFDEKVEKYGKGIVDNYRIIDHNGEEEKNLVDLGITGNGVPIKISRIAFESELLVSIGVVEPHQYAGYSGGYKTVAIGLAGDETISHIHSLKMLENPKIRLGNVEENPFQEDIVEIGKKVGLDFIVNVILGKEGEVLEIRAGEPHQTFRALIKEARGIYEVPIEKSFDVVICG